ncbi:AsmA-like C-terminal region-containing protein [Qingshengfaniella alkalisoli]|uniref:YhdP central domain-containing protein n=1 Tax=Qingshengfaniella alkalisoli TaxID=2599296 RepID=A0A5B8IRQ1_9RHOB|nr:AsmA-like C-terminal region-containing protein [Qingshengfaniella alkalisoli]QDY68882.1 hypothetical protein FPZ52_04040 [Qingshengfaniella alkalisoli]
MEETRTEKPRNRRKLKWLCGIAALFLACGAGVIWALRSGPYVVPDRIVRPLQQTTNSYLAGRDLEISVGEVEIDFRSGIAPVVVTQGLRLSTLEGDEVAALDHLEAVFATGSLLSLRPVPQVIRAAGIELMLERFEDGTLSVALDGGMELQSAPTPGEILAGFRAYFDLPVLSRLREIDIADLRMQMIDHQSDETLSSEQGWLNLRRDGDGFEASASIGRMSAGTGTNATTAVLQAALSSPSPDMPVALQFDLRGITPSNMRMLAGRSPLGDVVSRIDAPLSLRLGGQIEADGDLSAMDGRISVGEGRLQLPGMSDPLQMLDAGAQVSVQKGGRRVDVDDLHITAQRIELDGRAHLFLEDTGDIVAQLALSDLALSDIGVFDEALTFDQVNGDFRYRPGSDRLEIARLRLDRRGHSTELSGWTTARADAQDGGRAMSIDIASETADIQTTLALWPTNIVQGTRRWLAGHITQGLAENFALSIRRNGNTRPDIGMSLTFKGAAVSLLDGLPPISDASGHVQIADGVFDLQVRNAVVPTEQGGGLDVAHASILKRDVFDRNGPLEIKVDSSGRLGAVLSYFQTPFFTRGQPVNEGPLNPETADGHVNGMLELTIPMGRQITGRDVGYSFSGTLSNFRNVGLVGPRELSADQLTVSAGPDGLRVEGAARLAEIAFDMSLNRPIGPDSNPDAGTRIEARVPLSRRSLAEFGVPTQIFGMQGQASGDLSVAVAQGQGPRFTLRSNLSGVSLSVPSVAWTKQAGSSGQLEVSGRLGRDAAIDRLALKAPGIDLAGRVALGKNAQSVRRLQLDHLRRDNWLDVALNVVPQGAGRAPQISVTGGSLDLRRLSGGVQGAGGQGGAPVDVALDRAILNDRIALTDLRGRLTGPRGSFTARVNGQTPVDVRLDGPRIALTSNDAGGVFRSTGLFDMVRGGQLDLTLQRGQGTGIYDGQMRISDTALKNTPAMAELVSGLSVIGAFEQMAGEGITFSDVRAAFRLTPSRFTLNSASAVGPSLGLSLDGQVDLAGGALALQGVISPVYFVNQLGSFLTRRGEGLLGITFRLDGTITRPRLSFNPLSILTPGMFREIFRRNPPSE